MMIKLNEGEEVMVCQNHDKSNKPLSYLLMVREGNLMIREFGDKKDGDYQFLKENKESEK